MTRDPSDARLPEGVTPVCGDLLDVDAMRAAFADIDALFVLAPGTADEFSQSMLTINLARDAGLKGMVYLSVFQAETMPDVPHLACKVAVERMIEALDLPVTILRPSYFMQNDRRQKAPLTGPALYASPIGQVGISMVDTRDIGAVAANALLLRAASATKLGRETIDLVGPDVLTGDAIAAIWADALMRPIRHMQMEPDAVETMLRGAGPAWAAYDIRRMFDYYQATGAIADAMQVARLTKLLGRAPRRYRDFANETAAQWQQ